MKEQRSITLMIDVTPEDINTGLRKDTSFCPVARATKRAIRDLDNYFDPDHAGVTEKYVTLWSTHDLEDIHVPLPRRIGDKIRRYDAGSTMRPTSFELEVQLP